MWRVITIGIILALAMTVVATPVMANAPIWTQTTDADFDAGTFTNTERVGTGHGADVRLKEVIQDWSFEDTTGWTYTEDDTGAVFEGKTDGYCKPHGSQGYLLKGKKNLSVSVGDYGQIAQTVDLAGINTITFDAKVKTKYSGDSGKEAQSTAYVFIDSTEVWSHGPNNTETTYTDETIDVSAYTGTYDLIFRLECTYSPENDDIFEDDQKFGVDKIRPHYYASGTFESQAFDAGSIQDWDEICWDEYLPSDTDLTLQVATSDNGTSWSAWSSEYTSSPGDLTAVADSQWIKWKANFTASTDTIDTPILSEVRIGPGCDDVCTLTLYPTDDSWVDEDKPTDTHGSDTKLYTKSESDKTRRAYLKFNLSDVPDTDCIWSATLWVLWQKHDLCIDEAGAYTVSKEWTEGSITWNTAPTDFSAVDEISSHTDSWYQWDVISAAKDAADDDNVLSLALKMVDEDGDPKRHQDWWSSEESGKEPYLEVTYYITADFTFGPPICEICPDDTIIFTGTACCEGTAIYNWGFGDGATIFNSNPVRHSYSAGGDYTVTLTITCGNGCSGGGQRREDGQRALCADGQHYPGSQCGLPGC